MVIVLLNNFRRYLLISLTILYSCLVISYSVAHENAPLDEAKFSKCPKNDGLSVLARLHAHVCAKEAGLTLHYQFTCKKNFISTEEEFTLYSDWRTEYGFKLDGISPWRFISLEKNEEFERTLVIHEFDLSAAMVTKERKFSNSKGYYWDEDKYYCKRQHFDHD